MFNNKKKSKNNSDKKGSDLFAKFFSVIAAIVLWFYVVDVQNTVEEKNVYNIPIVIENFKSIDDYKIVSGMDNAVDVVIRGTKTDISKIDAEDIYASVDMSEYTQAGDYKCSVRVSAPQGVSVISRSISQITVSVDKTVSREFTIKPVLTSYTISDDYTLGTPELDNNFVKVEGPEELINRIAYAEVRLASLGELKGDKTSRGEVVLIDVDGNTINSPYLAINGSYNKLYINVKVPVTKVITSIKDSTDTKPLNVTLESQKADLADGELSLEAENANITDGQASEIYE